MDFFHRLNPAHVLAGWRETNTSYAIWVVCSRTHQNHQFPPLKFSIPFFGRMFFIKEPDSKPTLSISPLTSIPFRPKTGIPVVLMLRYFQCIVLPNWNIFQKQWVDPTDWFQTSKFLQWPSPTWSSSIPPAKPQRYPWQVPSHKPLARCLAEMAADAVHERAKIRRRQAGDGGMMGKGGVRCWWRLMEVQLRETHDMKNQGKLMNNES